MLTDITQVSLTSTEIEQLPWWPLGGAPGVQVKTLWRDPTGSSYAGIMRITEGAWVTRHVHRFATHHVWVETGSCRVGDRTYGPGAYLHVPAGAEHGIDEAGPGGCTFFYLYLATAEMG